MSQPDDNMELSRDHPLRGISISKRINLEKTLHMSQDANVRYTEEASEVSLLSFGLSHQTQKLIPSCGRE